MVKAVERMCASKHVEGLTVTTLTGHLILLVDVWTNFVHNEVEALSG
jgi:hypothetical protein